MTVSIWMPRAVALLGVVFSVAPICKQRCWMIQEHDKRKPVLTISWSSFSPRKWVVGKWASSSIILRVCSDLSICETWFHQWICRLLFLILVSRIWTDIRQRQWSSRIVKWPRSRASSLSGGINIPVQCSEMIPFDELLMSIEWAISMQQWV